MKQYFRLLVVVILLSGCSGETGNGPGDEDSVSTAPVTDPSYNPEVNVDSATKHMNLDSIPEKESPSL